MVGQDASVKIKVSENKMKVLATYIPSTEDGNPLTAEDVLSKLEARGVKAGIKSDIIERMCESDRPIPSLVIAEAIPPKTGEKARIETYIKPADKSKALEREDGSVDFRDLGEVPSAVVNQELFRKIPPTVGEPGLDVLGNEIPGIPGKDIQLVVGPGTQIDKSDPNLVKAVKDGEVIIKNGIMQIADVHTVQGDVDYESGNIKFKGSVKINGTVKAGFKVEADGDIEIRGNVEDAEVIGEKDVILMGGCAGTGVGIIQAGRDILVKFVENQTLKADRNIIIIGNSYHAKLYAGNSITAKGHKSTIVGGISEAKISVEAAQFGSVACAPTKIKVGIDPKLAERMKKNDEEIKKTEESKAKIEKSVLFLYRQKIDNKGKLPPDKAKLLEKLEAIKKSLPEKLEELTKYKKILFKEQKDVKKSFAISQKAVFPKVQVYIGNQWITVEDNLGPSQFRLINGEVARLSK